jgi:acyl-CoA synthetase (NDP forming)
MAAVIGGTPVERGRVGILSQSGALGIGLLRWATRLGLGVSSFVAVGNKADVSGNDVLQHWEDDDATDVVLLYLESFGNPRKFARVARRVARRKPVLAVRAGADPTIEGLIRQTGVIRVDSPERLFEAASVLATQPLPRGRSVGIVADQGGPARLGATAIEAAGLRLARLAEVPFDEAGFGEHVQSMLDDDAVDAVIVVLTDLSSVHDLPRGDKPVLVALLSPSQTVFRSPEAAALALAAATTYAEWRARPDEPFELDVTPPEGADGPTLLDVYGIGAVPGLEVTVRVHQDATFGPVLTLAVGGPSAALVDDRASSITPMTVQDAHDLVRSLRTAPVLFPAGTDTSALEDLVLRVSRLVEDVHEVATLDLDVATGACTITFAPDEPRPELAVRRLR